MAGDIIYIVWPVQKMFTFKKRDINYNGPMEFICQQEHGYLREKLYSQRFQTTVLDNK